MWQLYSILKLFLEFLSSQSLSHRKRCFWYFFLQRSSLPKFFSNSRQMLVVSFSDANDCRTASVEKAIRVYVAFAQIFDAEIVPRILFRKKLRNFFSQFLSKFPLKLSTSNYWPAMCDPRQMPVWDSQLYINVFFAERSNNFFTFFEVFSSLTFSNSDALIIHQQWFQFMAYF